ncbi:MAG TPA: choice-of-anchor Q domain-containing protein, partial [Acidimicrobiales bacterium]|nr:choice-of-anchor Q domain-containing protein [Acidimicrobiales bacterium]
MGAAAAALLCGVFGLGVIAVTSMPSGAAGTATLFVDNVNGTQTTGCTTSGAGACKTIQEGVDAAEVLTGTAVTLNVAGGTPYAEAVIINLTSASGDSLDIEGTGTSQPDLVLSGPTGSLVTIDNTTVGALTIRNMAITGGNATGPEGAGGGINDLGSGTVTVDRDTFSHNSATFDGGAIDFADKCVTGSAGTGTLNVSSSTFSNNQGSTSGTDGGAIDANDCTGTGTMTVTDSTFNSNNAGDGGAIAHFSTAATSSVTNSTFEANGASSNNGGGLIGAHLNLTNDTIAGNVGNGIVSSSGGGVTVANSILADPCAGTITDDGHNVAADNTCGLGPNSISNSTTIDLQGLAANGSTGPQTAAISTSSSAHGIVPAASCTVTTDERGQPRPGIGFTTCDAGAYEIQKSTGYDLAGTDGGVFVFPVGQPKGFFGSIPGLGIHINNIRGLVATNDFSGYNLVGSDGGVFVFPLGM